jgi:hypothetical protein
MTKLLEFDAEVEFVADINDFKDCLMSQDPTQENPNALWFNIDIPKGHAVKAGDRVRVTVFSDASVHCMEEKSVPKY